MNSTIAKIVLNARNFANKFTWDTYTNNEFKKNVTFVDNNQNEKQLSLSLSFSLVCMRNDHFGEFSSDFILN